MGLLPRGFFKDDSFDPSFHAARHVQPRAPTMATTTPSVPDSTGRGAGEPPTGLAWRAPNHARTPVGDDISVRSGNQPARAPRPDDRSNHPGARTPPVRSNHP